MWFRPAYLLTAALALTACGFEPVYREGTAARSLEGNIAIQRHSNRDTFELREALQDDLGFAGEDAPYNLTYSLSIGSSALSVTSTQAVTRYNLTGALEFNVEDQATGEILHMDTTQATASFNATAETYPTAVAGRDARIRLVRALADATVARLAITAQDWAK